MPFAVAIAPGHPRKGCKACGAKVGRMCKSSPRGHESTILYPTRICVNGSPRDHWDSEPM